MFVFLNLYVGVSWCLIIINLGYKTQCDKWIKIKNVMKKVDFNVLAWDGGPCI